MQKHYFAQLDENNVVINVIVLNNKQCCYADGMHDENLGTEFCKERFGHDTIWIETYRDYPKGEGRKGNHAGIGMTYMTGVQTLGVASTDIFIRQKPYPSWNVGINTAEWYSPIEYPELTEEEKSQLKYYSWDEDLYQSDNTQGWILTDN